MTRRHENVTVATCDVVHSSRYSTRERRQIQTHLLKSWTSVQREYGAHVLSSLSFRVTAGDEFQFVCRDMVTALDILTVLRLKMKCLLVSPPVVFRVAIASGQRTISSGTDPYAQDGAAFHAAREGIEEIKRRRRLTIVAGSSSQRMCCVNTMFMLMDLIYSNWTPAQAQVLQLALSGSSGEVIARRLKIKPPTVSRHLHRAAWQEYQSALSEIKKQLMALN